MTTKINLNLFSPYKAQKQVVRACLDDEVKYVVYNASRQSGKTLLLCNMAIYYALSQPYQNIMVVSPTDSQVRKLYRQIENFLSIKEIELINHKKIQPGDSQIITKNSSTILFRSAASEDSLRGYSVTHLLLDECAFIKEDTYQTILAPTLTVKGKKVLFCSTPKGQNLFYKLYLRGQQPNQKIYKSFKTTYRDNPYANLEFIQQQKELLPDTLFQQEYEGEFVDNSAVFRYKFNDSIKPSNRKYIGIDVAFKKDFTVAVCLNEHGQMVDYVRFNDEELDGVENELLKFINKHKPVWTQIEVNNQGLLVYQQLKKSVKNISEFVTSHASKPKIINNLIYAVNAGEVTIINDEVVREEFNNFGYMVTPAGNLKFESIFGHDDIVMATAMALDCKIKYNSTGKVMWV